MTSTASRIPTDPAKRWPLICEALRELSNAREAWEALATHELIPPEWASDEHRFFAVDGARAFYPPTVEAAASIALVTDRCLAAEQLGFELARTLNAPRKRVLWRFGIPRNLLTDETELFPRLEYEVHLHVERSGLQPLLLERCRDIAGLGVAFREIAAHEIVLACPFSAYALKSEAAAT